MLDGILAKISDFFGKMLTLQREHGFWSFVKVILLTFLLIGGLFTIQYWATKTVEEEQIIKQKEEHDYQLGIRKEIQPQVQNLLTETRIALYADRACILELHNGTNNTAGLPFVHTSMTYEDDGNDIESIDEDYQNITLSRFTFPLYLHKHNYWMGSLTELQAIDKKLMKRMVNNGAAFVAIVTLRTSETELGYLCLTWCQDEKIPASCDVITQMLPASQRLSKLLEKNFE